MNGIVEREHDVKSVGIETDEDWEQPVRRVIPKLADLEVAAVEAGAELDAVISAANSNEYARERLNRIYAFVYHAVRTDPEGFAVRTKVKVRAGVAYAPYLRPTKHIFKAVLNDRRCAGADIAGGVRNSISRYAKVFAWAGENGVQPEDFLSFLNDNGGIHGVEQSYQDAHGSRKNGPNDADKAKLAKAKAAMNSDEDAARQKSDGSVVITLSADEVRLIRTLLVKQPDDEIVGDLLARLISGLLPVEVAGEFTPAAKEDARALVLDKAVEWQGGYGSKEWELEWGALLSFTAEELERHSAGIAALEAEGFLKWDDAFNDEGKAEPDYDGWRAFFLPDAATLYLADLNRRHHDAVKKAGETKAKAANINTKPQTFPVAVPVEDPEDPDDTPPSGGVRSIPSFAHPTAKLALLPVVKVAANDAALVLNGESSAVLATYPDNHFDSVVTDNPYLIGFMGKEWDATINDLTPVFRECFRVLKPGGYLIGFSLPRTQHRVATMIENAGFEICDTLAWIFAQGFPKGNNLKPGHEAIVLARKPFKGALKKNEAKWGVGGLNIDACRVPLADGEAAPVSACSWHRKGQDCQGHGDHGRSQNGETNHGPFKAKRTYPAGGFARLKFGGEQTHEWDGTMVEANPNGRYPSNVLGEFPPEYQKFYFCPKASAEEKAYGCEHLSTRHPTVKPVELMRWLVRLVTPEGGLVLDPFMGSGTTGIAAGLEGRQFVGIEREAEYCDIAKARLAAWRQAPLTAKAVVA